MQPLRMLSLFSGIGGIDLAAEWAGIKTVAFCEIEPFCQKVLRKHWPDVPIFDDIRKLTKEVLDDAGITGIDIVGGGYPCQPYSTAGKRKGKNDDRALWPEMFRIISELRPTYVIGENVAGHITLGLDDTLDDLESIGYATQAFNIPACAIQAAFEGQRIFVVGAPDSSNDYQYNIPKLSEVWQKNYPSKHGRINELGPNGTVVGENAYAGLLRIYNGLPEGMDRLKSLGNAVVPQQIYPILAAIVAIERWRYGELGHGS